MQYHIITVGSELTLGLAINTNAPFIAKRLGQEGYSCTCQISVPDNIPLISKAIRDSLSVSDGVIITGGLGPTADDVTREGICEASGRKLVYQPWLAEIIKERYGQRSTPLPDITFRQAYLPEGAKAIIPTIGSAPGTILESDGKFIISLPGVPREMTEMIEKEVVPWLKSKYRMSEAFKVRVLRTTARTEASLQEQIDDIMKSLDNVSVGILAYPGEIQLQLLAKGPSEEIALEIIKDAEKRFVERLGNIVFGFDDQTLEEVVGMLLRKNNLSIAVAESCTGGLTAKKITDIPGSSDYFLGGIVTYSDDAKRALLNVSRQTLQRHGAVSAATALAMAYGVREKFGSEIGLGITGIAGPTGGSPEKPVGLVYIGLSDGTTSYTNRYVFFGSREIIRLKSSSAALDMARYFILENFEQDRGDAS
ncbi:MAG: competence/damage-inducible protein A [Actinomycetota bacterium]|nr:competence/damage-inducible protein A [Actinomycetota bacterium]